MLTKEEKKERAAERSRLKTYHAKIAPQAEILHSDQKNRAIQFYIEEGTDWLTFRTNSVDVFRASAVGADAGYKEVSVNVGNIETLTSFTVAFSARLAEAVRLQNEKLQSVNTSLSLVTVVKP